MDENELITMLSKANDGLYFPSLSPEEEIRALMAPTLPERLPESFYPKQDAYLRSRLLKRGIVEASVILSGASIALYQGDITQIKADAIVNAANSGMLGCFVPLHSCIDNAIGCAAGLEVRRDLALLMQEQGHPEPNGKVKVTKGYNLPSTFIFHTVGPAVEKKVTAQDRNDLRNCYLSCLDEAKNRHLMTIVFPSISTGVFRFPLSEAVPLAVLTVSAWQKKHPQTLSVIFDAFDERTYRLYQEILKS
jgi:O-acetyl-ADP-ribose deacetylase (regulator of RNase III)